MFGFTQVRLKGPDKKYIKDDEHISDYNSAEVIGRARLGTLCFYYRDLGIKYYVPYDYIEQAYGQISETQPDNSPAYYYFRLILIHGGKEFANLIFNEQEQVTRLLNELEARNPNMIRGYTKSLDKRRK